MAPGEEPGSGLVIVQRDLAAIEAAVPAAAAGDRYPTELMAHMDSEH